MNSLMPEERFYMASIIQIRFDFSLLKEKADEAESNFFSPVHISLGQQEHVVLQRINLCNSQSN